MTITTRSRGYWLGFLFAIAAWSIPSCRPESTFVPPLPEATEYHLATAPDSVLHNFLVAYRRRDIEAYTEILASDFRFVFTNEDAQQLGTPSWTRLEDTGATEALFSPERVSGITLEAQSGTAAPAEEIEFPPGTQKIHLTGVGLRVSNWSYTTWHAETPQDLYFRQGLESEGEDPLLWYLLEWREIPAPSAPEVRDPDTPTPVLGTTWGGLKASFQE